MSKPFLLGIDQGTSGSKAVILDREGIVHGLAYCNLERLYPRPGRVEQNPAAVAQGVAQAITEALGDANCHPNEIAACGLASQRNTEFVWDKGNGRALANAITWQDLRTAPILQEFEQWPHAAEATSRLGYPPGTYMTALHLAWRMRYDTAVAAAAKSGDLRIGLSTAWLINALGKPSGHKMDSSLIQAMGLYDFRAGTYWSEWLDWLGVSEDALPTIVPTLHNFGSINISDENGRSADVPILAMIGDQQAALFGQNCRQPGDAECTHGTASYVKVFLGQHAPQFDKANIYYAWDLGDGQTYCLEAPTTVTGAAIRWMRDNACLFSSYEEMNALATAVSNAGGVAFVPAFTGLDVPYNEPATRAAIFGLTLGHNRGHIFRAFFESIGYQMRTILDAIAVETDVQVPQLIVGGGVSASDLACQIQADLLGIPIMRPAFTETTAWAAAVLAGLGAGVWPAMEALPTLPTTQTQFLPQMNAVERDFGYGRWQTALSLARTWGNTALVV